MINDGCVSLILIAIEQGGVPHAKIKIHVNHSGFHLLNAAIRKSVQSTKVPDLLFNCEVVMRGKYPYDNGATLVFGDVDPLSATLCVAHNIQWPAQL